MITPLPVSQQIPTLSETQDASPVVSVAVLSYFRGRLSNRVHELVLSEFAIQEREGRTSKAELARRIGRKPEQITRWLGSPGNWTLDTLSDLLLGMGLEPEMSVRSLPSQRATNLSTLPHAWWAQTYVVDIQTPQEVVRDFAEGNHKALYFSLRVQGGSSVGVTKIDLPPQLALPQPNAFSSPIAIKEYVNDNN